MPKHVGACAQYFSIPPIFISLQLAKSAINSNKQRNKISKKSKRFNNYKRASLNYVMLFFSFNLFFTILVIMSNPKSGLQLSLLDFQAKRQCIVSNSYYHDTISSQFNFTDGTQSYAPTNSQETAGIEVANLINENIAINSFDDLVHITLPLDGNTVTPISSVSDIRIPSDISKGPQDKPTQPDRFLTILVFLHTSLEEKNVCSIQTGSFMNS